MFAWRLGEKPDEGMRDHKGWLTLVSAVGVVIIWNVISVLAGRSPVTREHFVPNTLEVIGSFDTLAYYWHGGLGVKSPDQGADISVLGGALSLAYNTGVTLLRLVSGLVIGIFISCTLAVLVSWWRLLRRTLLLPAHAARMLPLIGMYPLFGIWFGSSVKGSIIFVAFATFAIVFVVALNAIDNVPRYYAEYARSLGARPLRVYLTAVVPASLPALRGGILLALGFGWSMVIASEFIGQDTGLGNIVNRGQEFGRTNTLAILGVFIVFYGWASYKLAGRVFDRMVSWAE